MTKWKEQFDKVFGLYWGINSEGNVIGTRNQSQFTLIKQESIKNFISTQIIEKIIDYIPDGQLFDEDNKIYNLKEQLRMRWLNERD